MVVDLDTFLVIVYSTIDDLYKEFRGERKSKEVGRKPSMSDSEVLTLAILCQWEARRSEREFLRWAEKNLRAYFPFILSQAEYNRRLRDLVDAISILGGRIAWLLCEELGLKADYEIVDGTGVPLMSRKRGERRKLFGDEVDFGKGGSDWDWFYGVRVLVVVDDLGLITGFVVGSARTEERWLAESLLRWRQDRGACEPKAEELAECLGPFYKGGGPRKGPSGPISSPWTSGVAQGEYYLADRGFSGKAWAKHWCEDLGARVMTEADYKGLPDEEKDRQVRKHRRKRQTVETVIGVLGDIFGLKFPRARTYLGLICRLAAKVAAFNIGVGINYLFGRPTFAILNPIH
jgi:Transposase DDE domain